MVDIPRNVWIIKNRFKPGFDVDTHYHSGTVFAFTEQGEWYYKEYPHLVNKAGPFLYEPAHSIHILLIDPSCKEDAIATFVINGSNVNIDENGNTISILDAQKVYSLYKELCKAQGLNCDKVLVYK